MEVQYLSPDELIPYERNAKQHPPDQIDHIANSIKRFGWQQPIVVDKNNVVIIGHGRLAAAKQLMLDSVPVVYADNLTEEEVNALRLADNKTNESPWDFSKLEEELAQLAIDGFDMEQFGFDADKMDFAADDDTAKSAKGNLATRYLVPPFSVIYGNKNDWIERKHMWVEFGIRSEIGRGGKLVFQLPEWMERQSSYKGGVTV